MLAPMHKMAGRWCSHEIVGADVVFLFTLIISVEKKGSRI